jgi:hypothetical protein
MRNRSLAALMPALVLMSAPAAAAPVVLDDIRWQVATGRDGPRLNITRDSTNSNGFDFDERIADGLALRQVLDPSRTGAVTFSLQREPGTISCSGTLRTGRGSGRCRFVSAPAFEAALARRAIPLPRRETLFELALVDARIARADGLGRAGFPMRNTADLIGASALDVSESYAEGLKTAGLSIRSFNDLIACRALKIDPAWVRSFAQAGYRLDARRAIALKATGVTPDYARTINAGAAR